MSQILTQIELVGLNDKNKSNKYGMKNKRPLFWGAFIGFICILYLNDLFQYFIAYLFSSKIEFYNYYFFFKTTAWLNFGTLNIIVVIVHLSGLLFSMMVVELGFILLRNSPPGFIRYFAITFQLINIGYILISIFWGSFVIILNADYSDDFGNLVKYFNVGEIGKTVIVFLMIFTFLIYFTANSQRLSNYINISNTKKDEK